MYAQCTNVNRGRAGAGRHNARGANVPCVCPAWSNGDEGAERKAGQGQGSFAPLASGALPLPCLLLSHYELLS